MSLSRDIQAELCRLLWAYQEGSLSQTDAKRLETLLLSNPDARSLFVSYSFLCGSLEWDCSANRGESETSDLSWPQFPSVELDLGISESKQGLYTGISAPIGAVGFPGSGDLSSPALGEGSWGRLFHTQSLSHMTSVLVVCFATLVAWYCSTADYHRVGQNSLTASSPQSTYEIRPASIGRVTDVVNCRWSEGAVAPACLDYVTVGQRFHLESGLLEITYNSGAKIILQGPAIYEVRANGGYLASGSLVGNLAQYSNGDPRTSLKKGLSKNHFMTPFANTVRVPNFSFAICTSKVGVVNLASNVEFGVRVQENQSSLVHVFRGSVALCSMDDVTEQPYSILNANESFLADRIGPVQDLSKHDVYIQDTPFVRNIRQK